MNRSPLLRYGVAAGSVILGWLARESLTPGVGQTALPFIFFFPAAALAAWFGGFGPGLVSTILSAAAADWFFIEPVHSWSVGKFGDVISLASFLISSLLIVAAIEAMHRARARALLELTERERLEAEVARLKETFSTTIGGIRSVGTPSHGPSGGRPATTEASGATRRTGVVNSGFPAAALRWCVMVFAAYAVMSGSVTLIGWFAGLPRLTDWMASGISMFPNAAFGALCSGAALILATLNQRWCARLSGVFGLVVLLLGSATLFQHFSGLDLGIDTMLVEPTWGVKAAVSPGRMGPPASTSYTLLGLALVLIATGRDRARRIVPALGIVVCAISVLALMGYASGADPLFAVAKYTGIAMQTATVLLALALGVLASVPEYEPVRTLQAHNAAGLLARRSLPFIIGLPFVLGWLRIRGQEVGWFDTAMGTSLLALLLVVIFCVLLRWWVGAVATHENELAAARDMLVTTVASIGDAVIATDADGDVLFLNVEAERLTGWKNSEAKSQPLAKIFHIINEQTRQPADNPVEKVFRTGMVAGLANHTLLISRDGTETPIDDSAAPIREMDSPLFGVVLVFRDVTEQRKAQQAASRLAAIVEHSGDAIFTKNLDGTIQTWNPSAERLFGYRAEEIVGKPVTTLLPPERLSEEEHIVARLKQGQPVERLESVRVAKDGRRIPVAVSVSPLRNGDSEVIGASKIIHDISEVIAAREALVREKELLATTLASIGDAVIVTDAEGRITFLNAEAECLTRWSSADAAGQALPSVFHIVNEGTRALVENPVEKVLRLGGVVGLANHTVLIAKDGTETPIDDSAAPIQQPGGPLFGVVLVFRDFTARKNAEEAQAQLIRMLDSGFDAIVVRDEQDRIIRWNSGASELYGWRREEALGQVTHSLFQTKFPKPLEAILADVRRDGRWEGELIHTRKDGSVITVFSRWTLEQDEERQSILETNMDITERKQSERRLSVSHGVTRVLAESPALDSAIPRVLEVIGEGLDWTVGDAWMLDFDAGVLRCLNLWRAPSAQMEAFEAISHATTFRPGSSLPGRVWASLKPAWTSDVGKDANFVRAPQAVAAGLCSAFAFPIVAGDKFLGVMEFFSSELREPDDALLQMFTGVGSQMGQFIERKRAEDALVDAQQELQRHAADLEATVAERTAKLRETVNDLQGFSYSIAHDMRAPLRAMGTFAQLLMSEIPAASASSETRTYCERIVLGAARLDNLINDALNYTKTALQEFQLQPVEMSKLVRGLLDTYPNLHAEHADIQLEGKLPIVLGNEALLTQCFSNLLGNAVKFIAPGQRPKVRVYSEVNDGVARISVEDNGIGIPKHAQPRLFAMFQKLDNQYEGTGIGLAIVRKVVERMGGKVGVESEPDRGSRFWVELRVAPKKEDV